ncbi:MAG TPA: ATP-binding cassette domain-containing protein, partial [Candidatus Acidoferrales bacterium]|nr:ATP-binding cassette domain-containing protein [Candidatus Acidoferrales bacterium]
MIYGFSLAVFRFSFFGFRTYDSFVPLLDVRHLTVDLPTPAGWVRPVNDVSFSLDASATLGLVGESGSGKTMLALSLLGLLPPGARRSGEALFEKEDRREAPSALPEAAFPAPREARRVDLV